MEETLKYVRYLCKTKAMFGLETKKKKIRRKIEKKFKVNKLFLYIILFILTLFI